MLCSDDGSGFNDGGQEGRQGPRRLESLYLDHRQLRAAGRPPRDPDFFGVAALDGKGSIAIAGAIGVGLIGLALEGFTTGRLVLRGGSTQRSEHPIVFWVFATIYVAFGAALIAAAVTWWW